MILVFGKTGQVARELGKIGGTILLDRKLADLTIPKICKTTVLNLKPDAVINAAAYTAVEKAEEEEELANLINGEAPGAIATACATLNIPLVHISTDYVFSGNGKNAWRTFDTPKPKNAYGRSKLKGEKAIRSTGCTHAILRTSWVFSSYGSNFVKTVLSLSENRDTFAVVNDQIGGPTCAKEIAITSISIVKQLIKDPKKSGIYHFSGMPDVSWCHFANIILKLSGRNSIARGVASSEYPSAARRPLNSRLNCSLTESTFDISRPYWQDGLKDVLRTLEINNEET